MKSVIGIDLGTTNCCVAKCSDDKTKVIADELGNTTFPSYVTSTGGNIVVGHKAKAQVISNPESTIFGTKRLIGRDFKSQEVSRAINYFPYKITQSNDGGVQIHIGEQTFTPSDVAAELLSSMKTVASKSLKDTVTHAVVTVPAYFNSQQRKQTKEAVEKAGLEVLRLINEPTAAALAYGFKKKLDQRVLVYDLGGGTFDVSILDIRDNIYEVIASNGDSYLGGIDFDNILLNHILATNNKTASEKIDFDVSAMQRLRDAAEQAKCELSFQAETRIILPSIAVNHNIDITVTQKEFEDLTQSLVDKTFKMLEKTLKECELEAGDIDEIILVGGQTRMPIVQQRIQNFFGKPALKGVHPDEAVAIGAAIHAQLLGTEQEVTDQKRDAGEKQSSTPQRKTEPPKPGISKSPPPPPPPVIKKRPEALLIDVTPLPLGVDALGDTFSVVINKNSTVPCQGSRIYTNTKDFQENARIVVRQGEASIASLNSCLGEFVLEGLQHAKRLEAQIEVTFKIDVNGILNVTAKDLSNNSQNSIVISEFDKSQAIL